MSAMPRLAARKLLNWLTRNGWRSTSYRRLLNGALKSSRSAAARCRHRQLLHPWTAVVVWFTEFTLQISCVLLEFRLTVLMASKRAYSLASQLARWQDRWK